MCVFVRTAALKLCVDIFATQIVHVCTEMLCVLYAWACVSAYYVSDYTLLFLSKTCLRSLGWCTRQSNLEIDTQSCWPEHIHIQLTNHLNVSGHRLWAFQAIIHQYITSAFQFVLCCGQDMKAHSAWNILPLVSLSPSSFCFLSLCQSDNVISRKSEILIVPDVCIFLSIPIHP